MSTREWMLDGVEHFNRLEFMEAHDSWEHIWLEESDEDAVFAQGLIQLAAAYLHIRRGTTRGAVRLINLALEKLEPYDPAFCGIDRSHLVAAAMRHREWLREGGGSLPEGEFPRIEFAAGNGAT